ncbi:MAG: DUF3568 family protein [Planctomycetota bacterium]|nr:DUF3568 family protein [Planctomycetota bacterium]
MPACLSTGCVVAALGAGAAGYAYYKGVAEKTYEHGFEDMKKAVMNTFDELDIKMTSQKGDNFTYEYDGKTEGDTTVDVELNSVSEETTQVKVRFGVFGDKQKSGLFFEELDKQVKKLGGFFG